MDDLFPPEGIDRAVLTAMVDIIRNAINHRGASVSEAAAEARGYCYARYPAAGSARLDEAVRYTLTSMQLMLPPGLLVIEVDGVEWRQIPERELIRDIAYMVRFNRSGKPVTSQLIRDDMPNAAASHLVEHMQSRGYVVMAQKRVHRGAGLPSLP